MANQLDALSKDYFGNKIETIPPIKKGNLWSAVFLLLFLLILVPTNYIERPLPISTVISRMMWYVPYAFYVILCTVFCLGKGSKSFFIFLTSGFSVLLVLEFWLIFSQFAMVIYAAGEDRASFYSVSYDNVEGPQTLPFLGLAGVLFIRMCAVMFPDFLLFCGVVLANY